MIMQKRRQKQDHDGPAGSPSSTGRTHVVALKTSHRLAVLPIRLVTATLLLVSTTCSICQMSPTQLFQLLRKTPTPTELSLEAHAVLRGLREEQSASYHHAPPPPSSPSSQPQDELSSITQDDTRIEEASKPLPIKWPQTTNRIQRAILEGERIVPNTVKNYTHDDVKYYTVKGDDKDDYEAPVDKLATVVSMFYDLSTVEKNDNEKRKRRSGRHSKKKYIQWMSNLLTCTDPMIFFCEPGSSWCDIVREKRQHAPTIIAYLPFDELTMNTNFDESFWREKALDTDRHDAVYVKKRRTSTYKVWNEKIILAHEASLVNPFETEQFYWIDSGYYRGEEMVWPASWSDDKGPDRDSGAVNGVIIRNNVTKNGVGSNQVLFQNAEPAKKGYALAGGAWGGTAEGIQNIYDHYWKTFWYMALNDNIWCLGYEQHVFVHMCKSFPSICNIQYHRAWRQMGEVMLRDPVYDFAEHPLTLDPNNDHLIADQDEVKLERKQPVVSGEVIFPHEFPVTAASAAKKLAA